MRHIQKDKASVRDTQRGRKSERGKKKNDISVTREKERQRPTLDTRQKERKSERQSERQNRERRRNRQKERRSTW